MAGMIAKHFMKADTKKKKKVQNNGLLFRQKEM